MEYVPPLGSSDPNASYVEGNPAAGLRGSFPTAAGFEGMMREIVNAISASGQPPDPANLAQLAAAIAVGGKLRGCVDVSTAPDVVILQGSPTVTSKVFGQEFIWVPKIANTGTVGAQLNVDGLGLVPLVRPDLTPLQNGDIVPGKLAKASFDGNQAQLSTYARPANPINGEGITPYPQFGMAIPALTEEDTIAADDLAVFFQVATEGGEAGQHHRKITMSALAAGLLALAGTPASSGSGSNGSSGSTAAGGAPTIRVFTSSQTYVPTPGRSRGIAFGTGGGGAGGSAGPASTGSTWGSGNNDPLTSTGTGGSGGSTFVKALDLTTLGAGVAITIGGGGAPTPESAAVSAGAIIVSQGGSGGTTSLGALANAPGGPGGYNNFGAYAAYAPQATGGLGDLVIPGQGGGPVTSILSAAVIAGNGGGTLLSPTGGRAGSLYGSAAGAGMTSAPGFSLDTAADAAIAHNGEDGPGWGTGGGGAVGLASGGLGGNGAPGVVIIIEF